MSGERPRVAVVTFPGSNDDGDARLALERLGAEAPAVWHSDTSLPAGTGGTRTSPTPSSSSLKNAATARRSSFQPSR